MITAYLLTIFLSLLVAMAELFTKFRDEPLDVLKKSPAWLYLLFNMVIASITLYMLTVKVPENRSERSGSGDWTRDYHQCLSGDPGTCD
jgi:hypothetical protein